MSNVANLEKQGLSVPEACHVAGFSRTKLYEVMGSGELPARKMGRRVIILRTDLLNFIAGLPTFNKVAA